MERDRETWEDRTEEWLCDAAMRGDVESLKEIMKIDGYILDKVLMGSFKGKNPLHMATSTGQKEFVLELLEHKQDLAIAVDTELGTALHIASSKGYLEIVELLVKVNPEMCAARDREGNNPLHIAAMKGNVEVLKLLLRTNPRSARVIVDRGDNILHLCVNYNQLASLKLVLDKVGDKIGDDQKFVNSTDISGNNILHLAVFGKRCEIIKYLLLERPKERKDDDELGQLIDVNARNGIGWTALDIHSQVAKSEDNISEYHDIKGVLRESGLKISYHLFFPFDPFWQKKKKDTLMIVSSLMATMSFQVGINPPGGVWQDTSSPKHEVGKAVIAYTNPKAYPYLVYFNTMIKHVLSYKKIIAVNATNKSGRSPLDIHHLQFRSENQSDSEIKDILLDAGAKKMKRRKQDFVGDDRLEPSWQSKRRNTFMIVSSLIATMAYQVGVNPPGGVWLDDAAAHKVGKAILAYNYPDLYPIFMFLNTAGFLLSLTTILLLIIALPDREWRLRWAQAFISWCTILTTAFSYTFSVIAISPAGEKYIYDRDASKAIKLTAMAWAVVISLIFVCHLYRLTIGILKEQQRCLMNCWDKLFKVINGSPTSLPNSVSGNVHK